MVFHLYLKQEGQGCDYTVGCGETLIPLRSTDIKDVREEVFKILEDYGARADTFEEIVVFTGKVDYTLMAKTLLEGEAKKAAIEEREEKIRELELELQKLRSEK